MVLQIGTGTNSIKTASTSSVDTLAQDFDSFLTLLTTQLKNQDPTSPMETNEFTQQIIGFSQVQQSINTNTNLEKLIEMNKNSSVANAVSYVDQFVTAETDEFNFKSNKASMNYTIPATTAETTISVKDAKGAVVATYNGSTTKGEYSFVWDGKTTSGEDAPAGSYSISIKSKDAAGTETTVAESSAFTLTTPQAFLSYYVPDGVDSTVITITDEKGKIINSYEGDKSKGDHKFTWDGKNKDGDMSDTGKYTITVVARDAAKEIVSGTKTYSTELVSQVDLQGDDTVFYFNDVSFTMDKIKSVKGYYSEV